MLRYIVKRLTDKISKCFVCMSFERERESVYVCVCVCVCVHVCVDQMNFKCAALFLLLFSSSSSSFFFSLGAAIGYLIQIFFISLHFLYDKGLLQPSSMQSAFK